MSVILLLFCFSIVSCTDSSSIQEDTEENALGEDYISFTRLDSASGKEFYSFDVPKVWDAVYDKNTCSGSEAFFNEQKTTYALIGFENSDTVKFQGLETLKTKDDFILASREVKNHWEQNEFLSSAVIINEGKSICDNESIKAYALEMEALVDLKKSDEEFKNFQTGKKQLVYILLLNYENKFFGYYALIDSNFNKKTDIDIFNRFTSTLIIEDLKK